MGSLFERRSQEAGMGGREAAVAEGARTRENSIKGYVIKMVSAGNWGPLSSAANFRIPPRITSRKRRRSKLDPQILFPSC